MPSQAKGTLEITSWDEQPYLEIDDDRKLTTTTVTQKLKGDVVGEGSATWLAAYRADGTADFLGFQRIVGTIGDAEGSIVLRMSGGYDGSVARSDWEVVVGTRHRCARGDDRVRRVRGAVGRHPRVTRSTTSCIDRRPVRPGSQPARARSRCASPTAWRWPSPPRAHVRSRRPPRSRRSSASSSTDRASTRSAGCSD